MPTAPGRYSVRSGWPYPNYDLDWADSAIRYQGGALNWIGVCALAESLGLHAEIGHDRIADRVLELTDRLVERLDALPVEITSNRDPKHRSSYLTFTLGSIERDDALVDAGKLRMCSSCAAAGVFVWEPISGMTNPISTGWRR